MNERSNKRGSFFVVPPLLFLLLHFFISLFFYNYSSVVCKGCWLVKVLFFCQNYQKKYCCRHIGCSHSSCSCDDGSFIKKRLYNFSTHSHVRKDTYYVGREDKIRGIFFLFLFTKSPNAFLKFFHTEIWE